MYVDLLLQNKVRFCHDVTNSGFQIHIQLISKPGYLPFYGIFHSMATKTVQCIYPWCPGVKTRCLLTCAPRRSIVLQFFWHVDTRPISPFLFFFNSSFYLCIIIVIFYLMYLIHLKLKLLAIVHHTFCANVLVIQTKVLHFIVRYQSVLSQYGSGSARKCI